MHSSLAKARLCSMGLMLMASAPALAQDDEIDPATLGFAPEVKRHALIIANQDYDMDGEIKAAPSDRPTGKHLKDLRNPCRDAALFRNRLLAARWMPNEIDLRDCNQTAEQMSAAIKDFVNKLSTSRNTLFILYFSGHGAQLHDGEMERSLLFGVKAQLDLEQVRQARITSPGNITVINDIAVDLTGALSGIGRQNGNGLLIVLDACRNNLVYSEVPDNDTAFAPRSLSGSDLGYSGVSVIYPTPAGQFADDGPGENSIFTKELSDLLESDRSFDNVMNFLKLRVAQGYERLYGRGGGSREPAMNRNFNAQWCVWGCTPRQPEGVSRAAPIASLSSAFPALASLPLPPLTMFASAAASAPSKLPNTTEVFQAMIPDKAIVAPGTSIDIFYCDDGPGAEARAERAAKLAGALATEGSVGQVTGRAEKQLNEGGAALTISSVRLRRLSQGSNAALGFRYTSDVVTVDEGSKTESAWLERLRSHYGAPLQQMAGEGRTPGYISVAICQGPDTASLSPTTAHLQVPARSFNRPGSVLMSKLAAQVPGIKIAAGIETRRDGPDQTELRYYFTEDRDHVFAAAGVIETLLNRPVRIKFIPTLASPASKGNMEVWLGKSEDPLPKTI